MNLRLTSPSSIPILNGGGYRMSISSNRNDFKVGNAQDFDSLFEVGQEIGRGQTSVVRAVKRRDNGQVFACKFVDKYSSISNQRIKDEIKVLLSVRHPNIVSLYSVFETDRDLRLIVELVEGGELFNRIVSKRFYSEREACEVVSQLLSAVAFLHERNIIHRDIKPENILLASADSDTDIKLSDFGLVKIFEDQPLNNSNNGNNNSADDTSFMIIESPPTSPKINTRRQRAFTTLGTDHYIAPEVLKGEGYGNKVDLWSVGVVAYILLCGFSPFQDPTGDVGNVYRRIKEGRFDFPSPYFDPVSDVAKDLVRRLLTVDPDLRINAKVALNHPWIQYRNESTHYDTPLSPHHHLMFRKFNSQRKPGF